MQQLFVEITYACKVTELNKLCLVHEKLYNHSNNTIVCDFSAWTWTVLKHKNVLLGFVLGLESQVLGLGLEGQVLGLGLAV